jgi:voltage-gated potassium channel
MEQKLLQMRGLHRARMKQHAIIVGYDESTEELVRQLRDRDLEAIVVDKDLDAAALHQKGIEAIAGDPHAAETLERAGVRTANALVLPTLGDETAVMVALKAKELNPNVRIVATCARREDFDIMQRAKIDVVVPMSRLLGEVLAEAVNESKVVDFLLDVFEREGGLDLNEIRVERPTTVGGLDLRPGEKAIAVYRGAQVMTDFRPDTPLAPGDLVIALYAHPSGTQG